MDKSSPQIIIVKDSAFGKGIFTSSYLPKNTRLLKITGSPLTFEQTISLGSSECYSLQVGMDKYIIPDSPFRLSNHSCEPNCGINAHMDFITIKNIPEGSELLWDYSTSMLERHWTMACRCGSTLCRHLIRDFDQLHLGLQEKYLRINIVLPFIIEHLYGLPKMARASIRAIQ